MGRRPFSKLGSEFLPFSSVVSLLDTTPNSPFLSRPLHPGKTAENSPNPRWRIRAWVRMIHVRRTESTVNALLSPRLYEDTSYAETPYGLLLAMAITSSLCAEGNKPLNVVFIAVDDLNHWVGHLGRNPQTKTPNIDRLARMGTTFTRAYCAAPICNPSRSALLSGIRPNRSGVYDNNDTFTLAIDAEQSLVTQFRKNGYQTLGMGKLWHGGLGFPSQWTETGGREKKEGV